MLVNKLAIDGNTPVRTLPMPARCLITEAEKTAVIHVLDEAIASGIAFGYNGKYEQQYEKHFVDFMGGGFADGVNSGTNALFCALGGLQLDALSEVIVPPITDPGGVMPVLFAGCVPVFADSDPRSYNTNAEQIEKVMTERTKAIIVAHIAGEAADMEPIMKLAQKHNLYVIEDCAQAHGAKYKGKFVGSIGHIGAFSTMFGKHHCTGGQGGILYTQYENLHWQCKRFADRGKPFNLDGRNGNIVAGINCNSNDLAAAIGIAQITRLPDVIGKRKQLAQIVDHELAGCDKIRLGWQVPAADNVYWFLRFILETKSIKVDKELFCKAVEAEGIEGVIPTYRFINCEKEWFKQKAVFGKTGFPWNCSDYHGDRNPNFILTNAINVTNSHFNILINESYGEQEAQDIAAALKKVANAYSK
ncbi:MAG: hypothetical protein A2Y12_02530 [Planctomycetes bacterium GWF2_42_9]|nr:MAG: hypothetical protein A2Y12_02530 [Planctomycetes bacterium GWF2_42_9]